MASTTSRGASARAIPCPFNMALAQLRRAERQAMRDPTPNARAIYGASVDRLIHTPAPTIAGLAAKLAAADPFGLEHHSALLADARRLAGL